MQTTEPTGPLAVIHLGSGAISLLVAEKLPSGDVRPLELLSRPVPLGTDVFRHGMVGAEALERAIQILESHESTMREYGIAGDPARIVATNVLLEAQNHDLLLNRIQVAFGWEAAVLDDGEMTRLIYLTTRRLFDRQRALADKGTLVCHIGPGNTRTLFFEGGAVQDYHRYPLGLERTREQVEQSRGDLTVTARMVGQHSRTLLDQIGYDFAKPAVKRLVAMGHEIQTLARLIGTRSGRARVVSLKKLASIAGEIEEQGIERLAGRLELDFRTADLLLYTAELHADLAQEFGLDEIIVSDEEFEETLLSGLISRASAVDHFHRLVSQTALNLGRKFKIDTGHAQQVARLSAALFKELEPLHDLGRREALILTAAALLHETGHLIGSRDHHLHSAYIIRHNEVFGLDHEDTLLAALVARYHRGPAPSTEHADYRLLDRGQRLVVTKLAALLRVADSLDRGHGQPVHIRSTRQAGGELTLVMDGVKDTSPLQLALNRKAGLFTSVFGLEVVLEVAPAATHSIA